MLMPLQMFKYSFSVLDIMESKRKINVFNHRFLGIFLAFIVFALFLGQIRQYPEYPGEVGLHVNIINTDHHRNDDLKVQATIFDVCGFHVTPEFDVSRNTATSRSIFLYFPPIQPGWYPAIVSLSEEGRSVDSRYIYVHVS